MKHNEFEEFYSLIENEETYVKETNVMEDFFEELDVEHINRTFEKKYGFRPL
jgi:hypothetical protein